MQRIESVGNELQEGGAHVFGVAGGEGGLEARAELVGEGADEGVDAGDADEGGGGGGSAAELCSGMGGLRE
jgi:hypothetical protein